MQSKADTVVDGGPTTTTTMANDDDDASSSSSSMPAIRMASISDSDTKEEDDHDHDHDHETTTSGSFYSFWKRRLQQAYYWRMKQRRQDRQQQQEEGGEGGGQEEGGAMSNNDGSKKKKKAAAAVLVFTTMLVVAYWRRTRRRRRKRETTMKQQTLASSASYRSASTVPLSLLWTALEEERGQRQLQDVLLGPSQIFFRSRSTPPQQPEQSSSNETSQSQSSSWKKVDLPSNEFLQQQILSRLLTKAASSNRATTEISTLPPEPEYGVLVAKTVLTLLPFVYLGLVYKLMRNQLSSDGENGQWWSRLLWKKDNIKKRRHPSGTTTTTFKDVAGMDDVVMEVSEIVRYLQQPQLYQRVGATPPRGVLLYGPPGNGKTLLAQAVAGQANADCFVACSASDFCEVYVGRGAARVRSLFAEARLTARRNHLRRNRNHADDGWWRQLLWAVGLPSSSSARIPAAAAAASTGRHQTFSSSSTTEAAASRATAIIFIDELDALAKTRSSGLLGNTNDEREQTLNQLLTEMDGFRNESNNDDDGNAAVTVVVMGATNRVDVLDPAILRRFDRQIRVDYPDAPGRRDILHIHARRITTAAAEAAAAADNNNAGSSSSDDDDMLDLDRLAQQTDGFSGADLRNVINEAALLAVREKSHVTTQRHLEHAVRRIRQMKDGVKNNSGLGPSSLFPMSL